MDEYHLAGFMLLIIFIALFSYFFTLSLSGFIIIPENQSYKCPDCNIILISIDTLRADHLGCYGYHRDTSPNIDALANGSILFENAFSQSSLTASSHMSMFTSMYPSVHGIINIQNTNIKRLNDSISTLPEILKDNGYRTVAFTGGGNVDPMLGFGDGFDEYKIYKNTVFTNEEILKETLAWLRGKHEKFFMFFHTYITHDPYLPPEPYNNLFDVGYDGSLVETQTDLFMNIDSKWSNPEDEAFGVVRNIFWSGFNKSSINDFNHLVALYDGSIRYMDDSVGKIIKTLQESGLQNQTIIVFTADHGEEFLDHGGFLHIELYDEIIHVPLLIRIPGQHPARISSSVSLIDIMPTLLDIVEIKTSDAFQGNSMTPLMINDSLISDYAIFSELTESGQKQSVRRNGWKYISSVSQSEELFDILADPKEQSNIIDNEKKVTLELKGELFEWSENNRRMSVMYSNPAIEVENKTMDTLRGLGHLV